MKLILTGFCAISALLYGETFAVNYGAGEQNNLSRSSSSSSLSSSDSFYSAFDSSNIFKEVSKYISENGLSLMEVCQYILAQRTIIQWVEKGDDINEARRRCNFKHSKQLLDNAAEQLLTILVKKTDLVEADKVKQMLDLNESKILDLNNFEKLYTEEAFKDVWAFCESGNFSLPLFRACDRGYEKAVKYLIEYGEDVNAENSGGLTPLFFACKSYRAYKLGVVENIVKCLVEHGADVNKVDMRGNTPLFHACREGHENVVKYLVEQGANVNKVNDGEETPLFWACEQKNVNIVKCLVEHGANVNKADECDSTPLLYACVNGHENIVKYLVEHEADVNKQVCSKGSLTNTRVEGKTPLLVACKKGNEMMVRYLVEHGADVNKADKKGRTPLLYAKSDTIKKYLVEHGAKE